MGMKCMLKVPFPSSERAYRVNSCQTNSHERKTKRVN